MNNFGAEEQNRIPRKDLPDAVRACTTLSELFDLVRREKIVVQMHAQSGASNITPKKLDLSLKLSPLERMKLEVLKALGAEEEMPVYTAPVSGYQKKSLPQLLQAIDSCDSLSQIFALIQHENLELEMRAQEGASNLTPKKLSSSEIIGSSDLPLERLKKELKRSIIQSVRSGKK